MVGVLEIGVVPEPGPFPTSTMQLPQLAPFCRMVWLTATVGRLPEAQGKPLPLQ